VKCCGSIQLGSARQSSASAVWGWGALLFGLGSGDRKFVARPGQETRERERKRRRERVCKEGKAFAASDATSSSAPFFLSFFLLKKLLGPSSPVPRDSNALAFR